jgi:hypothetical protein
VFIYIELSQIYKSIFKLNIKGNSHIVQDERKQILCESPRAWRRLDAAWMLLHFSVLHRKTVLHFSVLHRKTVALRGDCILSEQYHRK